MSVIRVLIVRRLKTGGSWREIVSVRWRIEQRHGVDRPGTGSAIELCRCLHEGLEVFGQFKCSASKELWLRLRSIVVEVCVGERFELSFIL